jgi:DNA-binding transcriptional ArsR family regulator
LSISKSVDIIERMKRSTDPDVLLLQAAADPTRLSILRQLSTEGAVCACNFTDCCGVGQPTVSHHLRVLRTAGWVSTERRGTWIYYSVRPEAVGRFRELAGDLEPRSARTCRGARGGFIASRPSSSRRRISVQPGG